MHRLFLLTISILALAVMPCVAESYYYYVDENGDPVFTNVPPVDRGLSVQVSGEDSAANTAPPPKKSESFDEIIEKVSRDYRIDPSLIRSIIATESGFNPRAVSPKGARGLMQLMPATARRLGVRNSFDPEENIRGGVKHFRFLMDNFNNNLELSLAAYNAGENLVQRLGRVPEIKETREYVKLVKQRYQKHATTPEEEPPPPLYRYYDESGVLHITNIPSFN